MRGTSFSKEDREFLSKHTNMERYLFKLEEEEGSACAPSIYQQFNWV